MRFTVPLPLQHEHETLHERLRQATQAGGEVGEAAKALARRRDDTGDENAVRLPRRRAEARGLCALG